MGNSGETINRFLVEVFHEILRTEEESLAAYAPGLSLRELHLIEAVCLAEDGGGDNRSTAIAAAQGVTAGTLTTAATLLERKGFLRRCRDEADRRVVRLLPTEKGRRVNGFHAAFHRELVEAVLGALTPEQAESFSAALEGLARFIRRKGAVPAGAAANNEI